MAVINRFSTSKVRIFTYNKDVQPNVLEDVSSLTVALYDSQNNLVYFENHPIPLGTGENLLSLPGYCFMIPTKEEAPYTALFVATYVDGSMKGQIEQITVN